MKQSALLLFSLLTLPLAAAENHDALAATQALRDAFLSGNAAAAGELLADDLHYVHSNGRVQTRREIVDGLAAGTLAYERFELASLRAQPIAAEVTVVNGSIEQRKKSGQKWSDAKLLFQAVWRRAGEKWRLVALQTAQPPPPKD